MEKNILFFVNLQLFHLIVSEVQHPVSNTGSSTSPSLQNKRSCPTVPFSLSVCVCVRAGACVRACVCVCVMFWGAKLNGVVSH